MLFHSLIVRATVPIMMFFLGASSSALAPEGNDTTHYNACSVQYFTSQDTFRTVLDAKGHDRVVVDHSDKIAHTSCGVFNATNVSFPSSSLYNLDVENGDIVKVVPTSAN